MTFVPGLNLLVVETRSMTARDRVFNAFKESFDLEDETDTSKLVYQEYPAWTSIGHMILVAALESEFDTMLETDDILEMSSFDKAVLIMSKYAKEA
jgi:acyl carrier protein